MEFKELGIIQPILETLEKKGYKKPTPIQEKTIPTTLQNKDIIGIAQTGTGKTAAFTIPILQQLCNNKGNNKGKPRALILAPTRELAAQIAQNTKIYGTKLQLRQTVVYGGVGITPQIKELQKGTEILIATPGRLIDLQQQKKVDLNNIEYLVLDEADRMLDMGFLKDVNKIISSLPQKKQSLFFSATMSKGIEELTKKFLKKPTKIEIETESPAVERIEQLLFYIDQEDKRELLLDLIKQEDIKTMIIFVNAKYKADKIARLLQKNGIRADAIHGNKGQHQRTRTLKNFKQGKTKALIATDIAARGIDIDNISHVINFDLPNEIENYVHRIGRTARAGKEGIAYSFCASEDKNFLHQIEKLIKNKIPQAEHKYHSTKAKNAKGTTAKPKPRRNNRRNNQGRRGNNNRRGQRENNNRRRGNETRKNNNRRENNRGNNNRRR
jgi:ATP-dependent RNA helicase RhlE